MSPDQKKVIWRTAAQGPSGAAYFVRTLATGSDVALARPYSRFSSDSNWIDVVGGAYPVAGGDDVERHRKPYFLAGKPPTTGVTIDGVTT